MYQTFLANSKHQNHDRQRIQQNKKSRCRCPYLLGKDRHETVHHAGRSKRLSGGEETILAHRKIATSRLTIDCIYALTRSELTKIDRELEAIANDIPKERNGLKR